LKGKLRFDPGPLYLEPPEHCGEYFPEELRVFLFFAPPSIQWTLSKGLFRGRAVGIRQGHAQQCR
jgi:hypothetical protein